MINVQGPSLNGPVINGGLVNGGYTTTQTTYQTTAPATTTTYETLNNNTQYVREGVQDNYAVNDGYGEGYEQEDAGCCGRHNRAGNEFGHKRFGPDYNVGNPATLMCRRCCVGLCILLGLLGLLGAILGLALGLGIGLPRANAAAAAAATAATAAKLSAAQSATVGGYGGTMINGVYVVAITNAPQRYWLIYGTEMPCNPYNNNTVTQHPSYPNCREVTTRIAYSNWTTTTVRTVYIIGNGIGGGSSVISSANPLRHGMAECQILVAAAMGALFVALRRQ